MALLVVHPSAQFLAGMLIGCWVGAAVACAGLLLLVGRRVRQLESINRILRTKLKSRRRSPATAGAGSMLVMPSPGAMRSSDSPIPRVARVN